MYMFIVLIWCYTFSCHVILVHVQDLWFCAKIPKHELEFGPTCITITDVSLESVDEFKTCLILDMCVLRISTSHLEFSLFHLKSCAGLPDKNEILKCVSHPWIIKISRFHVKRILQFRKRESWIWCWFV